MKVDNSLMMKVLSKRLPLVFGLLVVSTCTFGQSNDRALRRQNASAMHLSKQYEDSLKTYGDQLYAPDGQVPTTLSQGDMAPIFLPLTFYRDITRKAFALDGSLTPIDAQLLSMYLRHPELVVNTQSRLEKTGSVLEPTTVVQQPTTLVRKTAPQEPEAEPIDMVVLKPNIWTIKGD